MAPSSNAHTYRLLIFKELYSVIQPAVVDEALCSSQQRDEIMQVLSYAVNSYFPTPPFSQQPQVLVFVNQFLGEANYNKGFARSQGVHGKNDVREDGALWHGEQNTAAC
ncbi:MAG: hypothetical protein M3Y65_10460 [Pseudomonadota bacterium]|nr:hypothetical protein [Pseudomonadota bacterium]